MSEMEPKLRRNGSSVIQAMLKHLAEEENLVFEQIFDQKTVGTVPVETARPLAKAALY
jgi:hypothetical protein